MLVLFFLNDTMFLFQILSHYRSKMSCWIKKLCNTICYGFKILSISFMLSWSQIADFCIWELLNWIKKSIIPYYSDFTMVNMLNAHSGTILILEVFMKSKQTFIAFCFCQLALAYASLLLKVNKFFFFSYSNADKQSWFGLFVGA